ncbi:hypothetical protein KXW10_000389 [Aspergillus fumigatus]|nr:hypothetical protein KXW10_000389 [Aspergillus fumigatus]
MTITLCAGDSRCEYPGLRDHTLDEIRNLCCLDNGRHRPIPKYALGALEQLPLEIINLVLTQLDIRSLTDFRRVNQRALQVVDSIPQYKAIIKHAPASLRGIISIGTGRWISCQDLYEKLCTAECDSCGDFGGYLYLITCRRVCFLCFTEKPDYLPLLRADAIRKFGLRHEHLTRLPAMKSVPGCYSPREIKVRTRLTLFDHDTARQVGVAVHGTVSTMEQYALQMTFQRLERYQSRKSQQTPGAGKSTPRRPRSEDEFDGRMSNPKRFVAIVRAPFLDVRTGSSEWGSHCVACRPYHYNRPLHWRRKFTDKSFEDHIKECGEIIDGKHVRQRAM